MEDQESYLQETSLGRIILRGIKKLMTEMTSIKFVRGIQKDTKSGKGVFVVKGVKA